MAARKRRGQLKNVTSTFCRGWGAGVLALALAACSLEGLPSLPAGQHDAPAAPPTELGRVMLKVNAARLSGYDCGVKGVFGPATALKLQPQLNAAAQAHADDMNAKAYFNHTAPDGSTAGERVTRTGYRWSRVGENIAYGYNDADAVMAGWLASDGHCANLMNPGFSELGVGKSGDYWVQVFAHAK